MYSKVLDPSTYRQTGGTRYHIQVVDKFYVSHIISLLPFKDLRFSIGESVIYSDRFESIYLVPVLFFRIADHYLTYKDEAAGNAQLFSSLSYNIPGINIRLDATIYIDELSLVKYASRPLSFAYSFGAFVSGLGFDNLDLQLEYTRINPFAYQHSDDAQTYASYGYQLGHWIGSNADQLFTRLVYFPFSRSIVRAEFEYTRKGDFVDISEPIYQDHQTFLYGGKSYYFSTGLSFSYEILNNLFYEFSVTNSNAWGANNLLDVEDYKFTEMRTAVRYGF